MRQKSVSVWDDDGWTVVGGHLQRLPGSRLNWTREAGTLWDNSVVRIALKWLEDNFGEAPLQVYRPTPDGKREPVPDHPFMALIRNPNPYYDWRTLQSAINLSRLLDGNAYLYKTYSRAGVLARLDYLPHFMVHPKCDRDGEWITRYEYRYGRGKTRDFMPEEILHLRDGVDPENIRKGLSRTGAVLREIGTVNEGATAQYSLLKNMGVPGVVISPKEASVQGLNREQIDSFVARWKAKFTGDKRGEPFVQGIPVDVNTLGYSPEQMALDKLYRLPATVVCAAFSLDPMVLGLPSENKTYSNLGEAREGAYENCIKPGHKLIDGQLQRLLEEYPGYQPGDELGRDYSGVDALQDDEDALHKRAREDYRMGILKRSEARTLIGQPSDAEDEVYYSLPAKAEADSSAESEKRRKAEPSRQSFADLWRSRRSAPPEAAEGEAVTVEDLLSHTASVADGALD